MINILRSILDTISMLVNLLISAIQSLINLLSKIPQMIQFLISCLGIVPDVFLGFGLAALSIYVVLFMLNRGKS